MNTSMPLLRNPFGKDSQNGRHRWWSSSEAGGNLLPSLAKGNETSVKVLESRVTHEGPIPVVEVGSPPQFGNMRVGFTEEPGKLPPCCCHKGWAGARGMGGGDGWVGW